MKWWIVAHVVFYMYQVESYGSGKLQSLGCLYSFLIFTSIAIKLKRSHWSAFPCYYLFMRRNTEVTFVGSVVTITRHLKIVNYARGHDLVVTDDCVSITLCDTPVRRKNQNNHGKLGFVDGLSSVNEKQTMLLDAFVLLVIQQNSMLPLFCQRFKIIAD